MTKNHNNNELTNPVTAYYHDEYPRQEQPYPGLEVEMEPKPDCGEKSYKGSGKLTGRKALVTGADSGIGRATAIAYAREGADVALAYLPAEQEDADEVKKLIEAEGRKAVMLPGDLADEQYNKKMVKEAYEKLGGLDTLALIAGRQVAKKTIGEISTEQLKEVFAINVFSLFWTIKEALPLLPAGASIITCTSIVASDPSPSLLDYSTTKGAITAFTEALSKQLASKGIRVNSVAPGPVWTALQISGGQLPEQIPDFGQSTPYKRAGQPVEVAPAYVFLASPESSFISGQIIGVTGGLPL